MSWIASREAFRLAYSGRMREARKISDQAISEAEQGEERERAGVWQAGAAIREAFVGNMAEAKHRASASLTLCNDREVANGAGLAFALAGDSNRAQAVALHLERRFPEDTSVNFTYVPVLRAQIELNHRNAGGALDALKLAAANELGVSRSPINTLYGALYPIYFRGLALVELGQGSDAMAEFNKILAHPGIVLSDPVGALVRIQIARVYRIAGDEAAARAAYAKFFELWKGADLDIPLLLKVRAEYASLGKSTAAKLLHD